MTPDLFQRAEEALFKVLEFPAGQRDAKALELCAHDPELLREVRSLLAQQRDVTAFLSTPALGSGLSTLPLAPDFVEEDISGERLGPYALVRRIGVGGMGAVYEARRADGQFEQRTAIKIVKRGMDSDEIVRRFRNERQTLASLDHANITRLLDGGITPAGRPYLVMELVEGTPIDEHCERRTLGVRARLELFAKVCDAVAFAHRRLVVHRDLKPANILVSTRGEPKLLDFGIAKVLGDDRPDVTRAEESRLTPEYASPEQIRGEPISTAADIYALGVILYELLTSARPYVFSGKNSTQIRALAGSIIPPRPSDRVAGDAQLRGFPDTRTRLSQTLRGDLDTIVARAMHPDAARRYPSVDALADDLRRYLGGFPITARRDSGWYRVGKFVSRHKLACASGAAVAVLTIAGVVAIAVQSSEIARQRDAALHARDQSQRVTEFLADTLGSADLYGSEDSAADLRVRDVLDRASSRLAAEQDPVVRADVAASLGRSYLSLGLYEQAEANIRSALRWREESLGADHHDVAQARVLLGELLFRQGDLDGAQAQFASALSTFEGAGSGRNLAVATACNNLGAVARAREDIDASQRWHHRALSLRKELAGPTSLPVAESLNNLALVERLKGDQQHAVELLEEALNIRERSLGESHPLVLQSLNNLAFMLSLKGDAERAEQLFRRTLPVARQVFGPEHPDYARQLRGFANFLLDEGRPGEARALLQQCLSVQTARLPDGAPAVVVTRLLLTEAFSLEGDARGAASSLEGFTHAEIATLRGSQALRAQADVMFGTLELEEPTRALARPWRVRLLEAEPG